MESSNIPLAGTIGTGRGWLDRPDIGFDGAYYSISRIDDGAFIVSTVAAEPDPTVLIVNGMPVLARFADLEIHFTDDGDGLDMPIVESGTLSLNGVTIVAVGAKSDCPGLLFVELAVAGGMKVGYGANCGGPDWFADIEAASTRSAEEIAKLAA